MFLNAIAVNMSSTASEKAIDVETVSFAVSISLRKRFNISGSELLVSFALENKISNVDPKK